MTYSAVDGTTAHAVCAIVHCRFKGWFLKNPIRTLHPCWVRWLVGAKHYTLASGSTTASSGTTTATSCTSATTAAVGAVTTTSATATATATVNSVTTTTTTTTTSKTTYSLPPPISISTSPYLPILSVYEEEEEQQRVLYIWTLNRPQPRLFWRD